MPSNSRSRTTKNTPKQATAETQSDPAVLDFMRELDHPLKPEIEAIRQLILGVSPSIREEIKWNAPSFRTTEHFATFNLRGKAGIRVILHTGAKVKESAKRGLEIADPSGLIEWQAKDRGIVTFADAKDIETKRAAFEALLRDWLQFV